MDNQKKNLVLAALGAEMDIQFITTKEVIALHDDSISCFGGTPGVRDYPMLESAVSRQLQTATYESQDLFDIGASLAYGVCQNHAFLDGNKRTSFLAAIAFLEKNNYGFDADPVESYNMFIGVAAGRISQETLSQWMQERSVHLNASYCPK